MEVCVWLSECLHAPDRRGVTKRKEESFNKGGQWNEEGDREMEKEIQQMKGFYLM